MNALKHPSLMKNLTVHPIERFGILRADGGYQLAGELSEIRPQRLFNDACDMGVVVKGRHATHVFYVAQRCYDYSDGGEGELASIVLRCDALPKVTVVLFND